MRQLEVPIPKELEHLRMSDRGYLIPYFVTTIDGKPNFAAIDVTRLEHMQKHKLCGICGKKLYRDFAYYISGPKGYENRVSTDTPMHRVCAEYSLAVCPHMYFQMTHRREMDIDIIGGKSLNDHLHLEKPDYILLVKAIAKYHLFELPKGGRVYRYKPVSFEKYVYMDGILTKIAAPDQPEMKKIREIQKQQEIKQNQRLNLKIT